ncbi:MAG: hypothetical protein MJ147_05605 [Clostridia bacterium]|nr:hypothetical protein [Clostridia bacterium]
MDDKIMLNDEELDKVNSGVGFTDVPDPESVQTEAEAIRIVEMLGDGKDMGTWKTMSGEKYIQ